MTTIAEPHRSEVLRASATSAPAEQSTPQLLLSSVPAPPFIPVGTAPHGVAVAPNGRAYVANSRSNNVTVIDTATIYSGSKSASVIDITTNKVIGSPITVGTTPAQVATDTLAAAPT